MRVAYLRTGVSTQALVEVDVAIVGTEHRVERAVVAWMRWDLAGPREEIGGPARLLPDELDDIAALVDGYLDERADARDDYPPACSCCEECRGRPCDEVLAGRDCEERSCRCDDHDLACDSARDEGVARG